MPLAVLQTLWTEGPLRCVLLKQLRPPLLAVQVLDGTRVLQTEIVADPEEAGSIAASLWDRFSKSA